MQWTTWLARLGALALAGAAVAAPGTSGGAEPRRDGAHDFDFQIGVWRTHIHRLAQPLTGSTTFVDYDGSSVVRPLLDGRANTVELKVAGPAGRIEGVSVRLYNPAAHQWSLNYAGVGGGAFGTPTVGEFRNRRGEFYDQESLDGRMIVVRNIITNPTPSTSRFEQAYSDDGGKTWEVNWIADDTRLSAAPPPA